VERKSTDCQEMIALSRQVNWFDPIVMQAQLQRTAGVVSRQDGMWRRGSPAISRIERSDA
jgi:hypothetical protein